MFKKKKLRIYVLFITFHQPSSTGITEYSIVFFWFPKRNWDGPLCV